jgi:hypothetical protein
LNCVSTEVTVVDTWGYDAWSGMFGYLYRGDADVAITPMFITEERQSVLTYIAGTTRSRQVAGDEGLSEADKYPASNLGKKRSS